MIGAPKFAAAIAHRLERRAGPSAMSILIAATLAGFGLLAIGIGWVKSDSGDLRTEIATNRDRICLGASHANRSPA